MCGAGGGQGCSHLEKTGRLRSYTKADPEGPSYIAEMRAIYMPVTPVSVAVGAREGAAGSRGAEVGCVAGALPLAALLEGGALVALARRWGEQLDPRARPLDALEGLHSGRVVANDEELELLL